jgi:trehalose-phosphatase
MTPLWLELGAIAGKLASAETLSVGCDFDGTLTPIVDHPDQVRLDPRTHGVLERLARAPSVSLAIVSGRPIEDLVPRLGLEQVFLAGSAGLETLDPGGQRVLHVPPDRALPANLEPLMQEWCARFQGAWLEPKGPAFSLHFRAVEPGLQAAFCSGVRRRLAPLAEQVRLVLGKKAFDVLPNVNWDKAAAIRSWLAARPAPDLLFYFGDDTLDEPVHELVASLGGYAVAIGRAASRAGHSLVSPTEVLWFLHWLEEEWARVLASPVKGRRRKVAPVA